MEEAPKFRRQGRKIQEETKKNMRNEEIREARCSNGATW